jgi:putative endonuclease
LSAAWHVYILRCGDGSFYTGIARDVAARLAQHEAGRGARYTRGRGPLTLVHVEPAADRGEALRREAAIRRLSRAGKAALTSATSSGGAASR